MQTIQLQLQDDLYEEILSNGIDIQLKFKEYLSNLVDDGYPSITTEEAKKRVSDAVDRYKNGTGTYLNENEYKEHINNKMESLKDKYANN